ncbi:MAG: gamma-glutamylcyclotransferase [Ruegeria sp.]
MTIPDSAFENLPELRDKMVQPEDSKLRLSLDDFKAIDANARAQGRPQGWRLSHEEREARRKAFIEKRPDPELWVLGYGSLMWDPSINVTQLRRANLNGWLRRFCLDQPFGRGSASNPGLMMAIDQSMPDTCCTGVAMLIPPEGVETETTYLFRREMMTGAYRPEYFSMETPQGQIQAMAFCVNRQNERYRDLPEPECARRIASACGPVGTNIEYLENLIADFDALNIDDPGLRTLLDDAHIMHRRNNNSDVPHPTSTNSNTI